MPETKIRPDTIEQETDAEKARIFHLPGGYYWKTVHMRGQDRTWLIGIPTPEEGS